MMNVKDIDFRIVGMIFLIAGICVFIYSKENSLLITICMIIIIIGMLVSLIGIVAMIQKERVKEKRLEQDIELIIQPLVSKYSKINKELIKTQTKEDMETYVAQRHRMNEEMEEELSKKIPYLTNREIKKIIIAFNREQDSL